MREAERRLGLAEALAGCIREWRDQERVVHTLPAMLRFRIRSRSPARYEDADDCDALRDDPLFKLAVGRAPESVRDLCSQPTMSRLENAPSRVEVGRMTAALVDVFCRSFDAPPAAITLDIDDTCDPVHGRQQLSLFNAFYDTRCFLPMHVYHVGSDKPVALLPRRPASALKGLALRTPLKHLACGASRWHGPHRAWLHSAAAGQAPSVGPGAMASSPGSTIDAIFARRSNSSLHGLAFQLADDLKRVRAPIPSRKDAGLRRLPLRRPFLEPQTPCRRPAGGDRARLRRALHRHLARRRAPPSLRSRVHCARGQAENRSSSCTRAARLRPDLLPDPVVANRFRLVLHTAAYWLMLALRDAGAPQDAARLGRVRDPSGRACSRSAPAIVEKAARIRIHFASACPRRRPVPPGGRAPRGLGTLTAGAPCPENPSPFNLPTQTPPTSNPGTAARRTQFRARIKSTDKLSHPTE